VKLLLILFLFSISSVADAALKNLVEEYLKSNSTVLKSKAQISTSFLNISSVEAQKIWSLSYAGKKEDDNLEQVSSFATRNTETTTHLLSLGKGFKWGGEFALNNTLIKYKAPTSAQASNGFVQGIKYTQDLGANFLGRSFYSELKAAELTHDSTEAQVKHSLQSSLYGFATTYSQAKLNLSLLKLQEAALERAKRRKELIRKRVRDGLKEKVDLIQASIELLAAEEQVKTAQMRRKTSLEALSNALHRDVTRKEVEPFDARILDMRTIPVGNSSGNLEISTLEKKAQALKTSKDKVDYSFWPTVNAGLEYNVNDYDNQKSTAIDEGMLTGSRNATETILSLNAVWTFGNESQKIARAKNNIELKTTEMEKEKLKINFSKSEESLLAQLELLEKNLKSVKDRKDLALKALKEMTKLYNRGRADLDQVIRAEESLINTERNFIQYLAEREGMIFRLASLYGTLEEYLLK